MYLDKHRLKLLHAISGLQFVMIDLAPKLREQFITSRFQNKESKVSLRYANEMDKFFESPSHDLIRFENNQEAEELLIEQIHEKMSALFKRAVKKEESKPSLQPEFS